MRTPISYALLVLLLNQSCTGNKHLPSSNPPEYDPKKVYTTPTTPPISSHALSTAKSAEPDPPPIPLPPLEPGPNETGEWKQVPVNPQSMQQFKDLKSPCAALLKIVQGLGSAQLFAGAEGAALKKSLGSQADSTAQILDEQLAELIRQALGPAAANCPTPSAKLRKTSGFKDLSQPAGIVLTNSSSSHPLLLAQATPSQEPGNGYTVTTTRHKQDAPPGWVGAKTTDQTTRVGNKPETAGNRSSHVLVLGGKVLKCPTPEGVVAGDFEYAVVLNEALADRGVMRVVHIGLHAAATLKGHVGDDAQIQYIEGDLTTVAERGGTDVPTSVRRRRSQFRFVPSRDEFYPA